MGWQTLRLTGAAGELAHALVVGAVGDGVETKSGATEYSGMRLMNGVRTRISTNGLPDQTSVMESSGRYSKRLPALIENLKIAGVGIQSAIAAAGHFVDDAQGRELLEPGIDRGSAGLDEIRGGTGGEDRMNLQGLVKAKDRCGLGLEAEAVLLEKIEQPAGAGDGLAGGLDDAGEEEREPLLPIAIQADVLKEFVVGLAVALEVKGEIEERLAEDTLRAENEGDEQTAETTIAIEERVNGLELDVSEGGLEQRAGRNRIVVQEFFQRSHAIQGEFRRRRNEAGIPGTGTAEPILRALEFAGLFSRASTAREEAGVNIPDHPERKRLSIGQKPQAMLHGIDVAGNLRDILVKRSRSAIDLMAKQIGERRLGAFDLRREDGFLPDVGVEEKPRIRQE
jgi:hypothetical protein